MSTTIAAGWSVPAGIAGPRRAGWSMRSASRRDPISARPTRRAPVLVRHAGGEGRRRWDTSSRTDRPRHKYRRFPYDSRRPDADHIGRNLGNESGHPSAPRIAPPFLPGLASPRTAYQGPECLSSYVIRASVSSSTSSFVSRSSRCRRDTRSASVVTFMIRSAGSRPRDFRAVVAVATASSSLMSRPPA
jgi:hypothetical protein